MPRKGSDVSQLYLRMLFILSLSPLPRGVPRKGPDCRFPSETDGFGPDPGGAILILILILTLSTAGTWCSGVTRRAHAHGVPGHTRVQDRNPHAPGNARVAQIAHPAAEISESVAGRSRNLVLAEQEPFQNCAGQRSVPAKATDTA